MAISINKVSKEIQQKIIADYLSGKSMRQIEKDYNVSRQTTAKFLEKENIKKEKDNHYRIYHHNESFFEIIDTEEKAYWLGFIFADGHITNNENRYGQDQFGISCAKTDKEILYKFLKSIQATNPVLEYSRKEKGEPLCRVQLTSQKSVNDLIDKGCFKQKSLILKPPKNIPNEFIRHFLRGFFDGDGSITKSYSKRYNKYIYGINITSTREMCEWIYNIFDFGSIIKDLRRTNTYYFSFGGRKQITQFYHFLYDEATIQLDRKYNRFQEFLQIS